MSESIRPVPSGFNARIGPAELAELNRRADEDSDAFWLDQAKRLTWNKEPAKAGNWSFEEDHFGIKWYEDGELNLSVSCLDRHLAEHADRAALIKIMERVPPEWFSATAELKFCGALIR